MWNVHRMVLILSKVLSLHFNDLWPARLSVANRLARLICQGDRQLSGCLKDTDSSSYEFGLTSTWQMIMIASGEVSPCGLRFSHRKQICSYMAVIWTSVEDTAHLFRWKTCKLELAFVYLSCTAAGLFTEVPLKQMGAFATSHISQWAICYWSIYSGLCVICQLEPPLIDGQLLCVITDIWPI